MSAIAQPAERTAERTLWERAFVPGSLLVSAFLATDAPWSSGPATRILTIGAVVAWLIIFFPSEARKRVFSLACGSVALAAAYLGAPGPTLPLCFFALVAALAPTDDAEAMAVIVPSLAALTLYVMALNTGVLLHFDDAYGREIVRRVNSLEFWHFRAGPYIIGGPSAKGEAPTLQEVGGPWLPLWTAIVLIGVPKLAKRARSRAARVVVGLLVWGLPIVAAFAVLRDWPLILAVLVIVAGIGRLSGGRLSEGRSDNGQSLRDGEETPSRSTPKLAQGILGGLIATQIGIGLGAATTRPRTVAIATIGLGTMQDRTGPPTEYKLPYEAQFGELIPYLNSQGIRTVVLPLNWQPQQLDGADAALFINQQSLPTNIELDDLYRRVEAGMRLVVVADHTNIMGVQVPANRLLSRAPIRLRFDSAIPLTSNQEWQDAIWRAPEFNPIHEYGGITGISVGASLEASWLARPLVVGMRGFEDAGNPTNRPGGLGNMQYDAGEPIYGVPLVAEVSYGRGSVVAFGDTSSFQNGALIESARFVVRSLSKTRLGPAYLVWLAIASVLLAPLAVILFPRREGALSIAFLVIASASALSQTLPARTGPEPKLQNTFVYDTTLRPQYPALLEEEGSDRLTRAAWWRRNHILEAEQSDAIAQRSPCIVICSPTLVPSDQECRELVDYVRAGGNLMICSGLRSGPIARPLLASFGLTLESKPLGGQNATTIVDPELAAAFAASRPASGSPVPVPINPALLNDAGNLAPTTEPASAGPVDAGAALQDTCEIKGNGRILTRTFGKPTSILVDAGKGHVLLIADDDYASTKDLGLKLDLNLDGAKLLYELIGLVEKRGA